jgi:hypothetical protein
MTADFGQAPTTSLTQQHDSNRPDIHLKTIDYHHLSMSRDDGMDWYLYAGYCNLSV